MNEYKNESKTLLHISINASHQALLRKLCS